MIRQAIVCKTQSAKNRQQNSTVRQRSCFCANHHANPMDRISPSAPANSGKINPSQISDRTAPDSFRPRHIHAAPPSSRERDESLSTIRSPHLFGNSGRHSGISSTRFPDCAAEACASDTFPVYTAPVPVSIPGAALHGSGLGLLR